MLIHFPNEPRLTTLFTGLVKNPNEDVLRGIVVIVVQSRALLRENRATAVSPLCLHARRFSRNLGFTNRPERNDQTNLVIITWW